MQAQQAYGDGLVPVETFLDYMMESKKGGRAGVSVIVVSMQELEAALHMRIARAELARRLSDKAAQQQARRFNLNNRLFILVPSQDDWQLMQAVYEIRMLVLGTVGRQVSELGFDPSEFTKVLHTRRQAGELAELARSALVETDDLKGMPGRSGPLTHGHIQAVTGRAEAMGAAAFVREYGRIQAIGSALPDGSMKAGGREVFISMKELQRQLLAGVNLTANRNLFRELTMRLDEIVLESMASSRMVQGHISINLNVESLASKTFERIAGRLCERDSTELWIELDVTDVLGNLQTFREVRPILRRHDVYTMADGISPELIPAAEGTGLHLDGYKFIYQPEDPSLTQLADVVASMRRQNRAIILSRVEHAAAIEAGLALGIRNFQGFYIDDLLSRAEAAKLD